MKVVLCCGFSSMTQEVFVWVLRFIHVPKKPTCPNSIYFHVNSVSSLTVEDTLRSTGLPVL